MTITDTTIAAAARRWFAAETALQAWKAGAIERYRRGQWSEADDDTPYKLAGDARAGLWLLLEEDASGGAV